MNIFLQDLIYLTIQEYKDSTTLGLSLCWDEDIQILIWKAEDIIKWKIVYDDILIADVDNNIKKAVVLLADCLYGVENQAINSKDIVEEKDENHTRKYQINKNQTVDGCYTWTIQDLLSPYIQNKYPKTFRT